MARTSTKYAPLPPPQGEIVPQIVKWMWEELRRVQLALDNIEAVTVNYGKEVVNVTAGTTLTVDWKQGQKQRVEMGHDCTFTFAPPAGVCNLMLRLVQDGTGGRDPTLPASVKWQGGTDPTWVTTANSVTVMAMYFDGTDYHATASLDSK